MALVSWQMKIDYYFQHLNLPSGNKNNIENKDEALMLVKNPANAPSALTVCKRPNRHEGCCCLQRFHPK